MVTVYVDDDEAFDLWKKIAGLPESQIIRIAGSDNFWQMGDTGPCGPCSEIFYDHGDQIPGGPPGSPGRRRRPLHRDLESRLHAVRAAAGRRAHRPAAGPRSTPAWGSSASPPCCRAPTTTTIDLFRALIGAIAELTGRRPDGAQKASHRVIADHLRASSFLIADGVLPSNEGRGYVLRRIMRRAMRHAELLGAREPLMWKLVPVLVREMGQAYPELVRAEALIAETLKLEETRFRKTLERGLAILDEETKALKRGDSLEGETAFTLYDTYGFPLDLTQDALRPRGIGVDVEGFNAAMEQQQAEGARLLGGLRRGRGRDRVVSAAREARRDRVPRLRDRDRRRRRRGAGARRQGGRRSSRRARPARSSSTRRRSMASPAARSATPA